MDKQEILKSLDVGMRYYHTDPTSDDIARFNNLRSRAQKEISPRATPETVTLTFEEFQSFYKCYDFLLNFNVRELNKLKWELQRIRFDAHGAKVIAGQRESRIAKHFIVNLLKPHK